MKVFANGCFDILHAGHIHLLKQAKKYGDYLIVGLNSDDSVSRLKGKGRPVNNEKTRMANLISFNMVDAVIPFSEDTPEKLIRELKPDFLVKGDDWKVENIAGAEFVLRNGGAVILIPVLPGFSTTDCINAYK